jgi:hypothetical protein
MSTMTKNLRGLLFLTTATIFGTGCAGEMAGRQAATGPARWERRVLADGVELQVREDAGPEAQRVADAIQSEMRSRYMDARR